MRTYLADGEDAERILIAARALRRCACSLSGVAAGEEVARARDVLADVHKMFYAGEAWISWQALAARLAEQLPEAYAELTVEAILAQVRAFGVPSVNRKHAGQVLKGAKAEAIVAALDRRALTSR